MNTVNASFFNTVCAFFLTEARAVACQCLRQVFCFIQRVDKFTNHGMFGCTNQIQVFAFDFIHHCIHFRKAHNTCYNVGTNHEGRNAVFEASANHEISCVSQNCGMQTRDVAHQVIEAIACNLSCAIQINTVEGFHNICVIRNFKIGNNGFAESFYLYVFAVILTNGNGRVNDVGNGHHDNLDAFLNLFFSCGKGFYAFCVCANLCFYLFGFVLFALCHQRTNLLGKLISLRSQCFNLLLNGSVFLIQHQNLIYQRQLCILKFFADGFRYDIRVFSYKFNV